MVGLKKNPAFYLLSYTVQACVWTLNTIYKMFKACNIELLPLTFRSIIRSSTVAQREEASRPDFSTPLNYFLDGFDGDSRTTAFQRYLATLKARDYLKRRAALRDEIIRNPDILTTPVDGPLVIIGLPRSGTTMLQALMNKDPQFMSPMLWELINAPVPPGRPDNWIKSPRYKKAVNFFNFLDLLGWTDFANKHRISAELNEECVNILSCYFIDIVNAISLPGMQSLRHFMYNCPIEHINNAYEFYKMWLQCMFYKNLDNGKTPLVKAPIHTLYLETYRKFFPNANFIFTYRNISEMTASQCSLLYEVCRQHGYVDDPKELGKRVLEFYRHSSQRTVNFLQNSPQDSYMTFGYSEFTKDPLLAVRKIYSHFGYQMSPATERSMEIHLQQNPKNKHGAHNYSLADYGITSKDLKDTFPEFLAHFASSPEKLL